jgi:hypothetical protein
MLDYEVIQTKSGHYAIAIQVAGLPFTQKVDGFIEVAPGCPVIWLEPDTKQLEQYSVDFNPQAEAQPEHGFIFPAAPEYLVKDNYYKSLPYMPAFTEACHLWWQMQEKLVQANTQFRTYIRSLHEEGDPHDPQDSIE